MLLEAGVGRISQVETGLHTLILSVGVLGKLTHMRWKTSEKLSTKSNYIDGVRREWFLEKRGFCGQR